MPRLWADHALSTLASGITAGDATLTVATGHGARFPSPGAGDYFIATLEEVDGSNVVVGRERVRCTSRTGDVLTITRGQEDTTARAFPGGSRVELRVTAAAMAALADRTEPITLAAVTAAPAPPSVGLTVYARTRAGRTLPEFMGPSGVDSPIQPALFGSRVMLINPGSGTGIGSVGLTPTTAATLSHPTPSTASLAESLYRTRFQTSTTAGNASGVRDAVNTIWRGNAAGRGGFFVHLRFCSGSIALAGAQVIVGLASDTGALGGEPSALQNLLAVLKDSGHSTWRLARRTGTGTVQLIDTGEAYAANRVYDLVLFARPNWDRVAVRLVRQEFDGTATVLYDDVWTDNLPTATTLLGRHVQVRNGTTGAAANVELVRAYTESDF